MVYSSPYLCNFGTLKQYGDKLKLCSLTYCKQAGFEIDNFVRKGEAGNDEKLDCSLSRTKARIFELSFCNKWQYFVTLTLDKRKYDRYDLPKFIKDLSQMIRDLKKSKGFDIKYLLIPERHQDGAWHLHGFILGLPLSELKEFTLSERLPEKIRKRISDGKRVFTWSKYERKFGFADFELIDNHEAVSKYITKYVTKEAMHTISELNAHCFYASKGLHGSEVLAKGFINPFDADYYNKHCAVKWFDLSDIEKALQYVNRKDKI